MNKKPNKTRIKKLIILIISIVILAALVFLRPFIKSDAANNMNENPEINETVDNQEENGKNDVSDPSAPDTEQVETKQEVTILENEGDLEIIISEDEESFGE